VTGQVRSASLPDAALTGPPVVVIHHVSHSVSLAAHGGQCLDEVRGGGNNNAGSSQRQTEETEETDRGDRQRRQRRETEETDR